MKRYNVTVNGKAYEVEIEEVDGGSEAAKAVDTNTSQPTAKPATPAKQEKAAKPAQPKKTGSLPSEGTAVKAPLTGDILSVKVSEGDKVKKGDVLVTLEALKMENEIQSPQDGTVSYIGVAQGQTVETGSVIAVIK